MYERFRSHGLCSLTLVYCSIAATHKPGFGHGDLFTSKFGVGVVDLVKFELDCIHAHTYVVAPSYLAWGGASVVGGAARGFDVTLLLAESLTT